MSKATSAAAAAGGASAGSGKKKDAKLAATKVGLTIAPNHSPLPFYSSPPSPQPGDEEAAFREPLSEPRSDVIVADDWSPSAIARPPLPLFTDSRANEAPAAALDVLMPPAIAVRSAVIVIVICVIV